jgi:hypothetical protein
MSKKSTKISSALPTDGAPQDAQALRERVTEAFGTRGFEVRRDGFAPLCFNGRLLAEVTSYTAGTNLWYELAAFTKVDGFIASIKVFKKSPAEKDIYRVESFLNFAELCAYIEAYEPSHDIIITDDLTDAKLSTAEAMIRAAALRQRIGEAKSEYGSAAGDLLTQLVRLSV